MEEVFREREEFWTRELGDSMASVPPTRKPTIRIRPTSKPTLRIPPTAMPQFRVPPTQSPIVRVPPTSAPQFRVPPTQSPGFRIPPTENPAFRVPPTQNPAFRIPPTESPVLVNIPDGTDSSPIIIITPNMGAGYSTSEQDFGCGFTSSEMKAQSFVDIVSAVSAPSALDDINS